jgi:hypothetical protein
LGAVPQIVRFFLDDAGTSILQTELLDRNIAVADEPTNGTVVDGGTAYVYVADSQWEKYSARGEREGTAPLRAPVLLVVPLKPVAPNR